MKVIISGGTGYIGSEVLRQCIQNSRITSLIVLTRRDIEELATVPKVKVIIVKDFTSYDGATLKELETANAALWCLGTSTGDRTVDIEYPLTFIRAMKTRASASTEFRYIQLSGAFTEPPPRPGEQERSLWFFANGRRVRGEMEAKILDTTVEDPQRPFTVYLVKPGGVFKQSAAFFQKWIFGSSLSIQINDLARVMLDLAINGNTQRVFSNQEIIDYANSLQKSRYE